MLERQLHFQEKQLNQVLNRIPQSPDLEIALNQALAVAQRDRLVALNLEEPLWYRPLPALSYGDDAMRLIDYKHRRLEQQRILSLALPPIGRISIPAERITNKKIERGLQRDHFRISKWRVDFENAEQKFDAFNSDGLIVTQMSIATNLGPTQDENQIAKALRELHAYRPVENNGLAKAVEYADNVLQETSSKCSFATALVVHYVNFDAEDKNKVTHVAKRFLYSVSIGVSRVRLIDPSKKHQRLLSTQHTETDNPDVVTAYLGWERSHFVDDFDLGQIDGAAGFLELQAHQRIQLESSGFLLSDEDIMAISRHDSSLQQTNEMMSTVSAERQGLLTLDSPQPWHAPITVLSTRALGDQDL